MLKELLLAGAGGAIGTMLRYAVSHFYQPALFPMATLIINVTGSLAIGVVMALCIKHEAAPAGWKLFFATGICGGFTTFSAFSFENLSLLQNGKVLLSLLYIAGSVLMGIGAAWLGFKLIN